jgi:hypothetical protein
MISSNIRNIRNIRYPLGTDGSVEPPGWSSPRRGQRRRPMGPRSSRASPSGEGHGSVWGEDQDEEEHRSHTQ